jgi:hypothetical protein
MSKGPLELTLDKLVTSPAKKSSNGEKIFKEKTSINF